MHAVSTVRGFGDLDLVGVQLVRFFDVARGGVGCEEIGILVEFVVGVGSSCCCGGLGGDGAFGERSAGALGAGA